MRISSRGYLGTFLGKVPLAAPNAPTLGVGASLKDRPAISVPCERMVCMTADGRWPAAARGFLKVPVILSGCSFAVSVEKANVSLCRLRQADHKALISDV